MNRLSFSSKSKDTDEADSLTKAFSITHTNSSLSSNSSTTSSNNTSSASSSKLSALSHSLLPHKHPHHHHHHSSPHHHHSSSLSSLTQGNLDSYLPNPLPSKPLQFVALAFQLLLSVPGPTIKQLREDIIPILFWEDYVHRANIREVGIEGLLNIIQNVMRSRFKVLKFRIKGEGLMDNDGSATMKACAVGIQYDLVGTPIHGKNELVEERKTSVMAIVKILDGRIAQTDLVIDTLPFQVRDEKELSCSIM